MDTKKVFETVYGSLKRRNSKHWDYQPANWSEANPLSNAEGCIIKDAMSKRAVIQRVYFNVPAHMTIESVKSIAAKMIVVTPFGISPTHYDFMEMLKEYGETMNRARCDQDREMFVFHPKALTASEKNAA